MPAGPTVRRRPRTDFRLACSSVRLAPPSLQTTAHRQRGSTEMKGLARLGAPRHVFKFPRSKSLGIECRRPSGQIRTGRRCRHRISEMLDEAQRRRQLRPKRRVVRLALHNRSLCLPHPLQPPPLQPRKAAAVAQRLAEFDARSVVVELMAHAASHRRL